MLDEFDIDAVLDKRDGDLMGTQTLQELVGWFNARLMSAQMAVGGHGWIQGFLRLAILKSLLIDPTVRERSS